MSATIAPKFRLALAGKALLLLALAALFAWLGWEAWAKFHWHLLARGSGAVFCALAAFNLAWAASMGLLDAALGQAVTTDGAKPLKSRRSGYSLRTPDGRFVEYVLYNPWPKLDGGQTYRVTYGRFSRVLVSEPLPESKAAPGA